ncbi:MAG TPA: serine/threonine-protein kinase [Polyangium sp.]|nr:serine/threonine-protein kinase [Polyangium sp.]
MSHSSPNVLVGALLDDRYRVVQHVTTGGVGHLYVVEDVHARGRVKPCFAAKILRFEHLDDDTLQARFAREIEATTRIRDPHVLKLFHQGKLPSGVPYFVAELLTGMDLADRLELNRRLAPRQAVNIAAQIAQALAAAHRAGVVHRDLKPENVFLAHAADGGEHIKLLDFGFSWINEDPSEVFSGRLTLSRTGVGTPEYVAPEQAFGDIGRPAADIYSLGIVLYEMLEGRVPFDGSPEMILQQHVRALPPPLEHGSPELRRIVERALAKEPPSRYESATEMAEALLATPEGAGLAKPSPSN